jgi:hypothetical protein
VAPLRGRTRPMKFDVVICCAQKDYHKLPLVVGAAMENIIGFDTLYLITPTPVARLPYDRIRYCSDREALDIDATRWRFRPTWIYQQFLKLFQRVSANDYYATLDADVVIARPLPFFSGTGRPIWYFGRDQMHKPYFTFQKKMFGFGKTYEKSFINDMNFLSRSMMSEMLVRHGMTFEQFLEKSYKIITKTCFVAEPELYGSYIVKYHPDLYEFRTVRTCFEGKHIGDSGGAVWDDVAMRSLVREKKKAGFDIIAMHSWDG